MPAGRSRRPGRAGRGPARSARRARSGRGSCGHLSTCRPAPHEQRLLKTRAAAGPRVGTMHPTLTSHPVPAGRPTPTSAPGRRLEATVALVTGAGRGIGRDLAVRFARAGAAVVLLARSADELAASVALIEA